MHQLIWWWGIIVPLISGESDWVLHNHGGQPLSSRCPCLPVERCPRVFGHAPESDYRHFGILPICRDSRLVRCCGASFHVESESRELMDNEHLPEVTTLGTTTLADADEGSTEQPNNLFIVFAKNSNKERSMKDQSSVVVVLPETTPSEPDETEATTVETQTTITTEMPSVETTTHSNQRESIKSILARRRPPLFRPKSSAQLQRLSNRQQAKNQTSPNAETQTRATEVITIRRPPRVLPKVKLFSEENIDSTRQLFERSFGQRINPRIRSRIENTMSFGNRFLQEMSSFHHFIMDKLKLHFKEEKNSADDAPREAPSLPLSWLRNFIHDEGPVSEIIFEPVHQTDDLENIVSLTPSGFQDSSMTDDGSALLELPKETLPHGPYDTTNSLPGPPPKPPIPPALPEDLDINLENDNEPLNDFINKMHKYYQEQQNYYLKQVEYYEKQQKYYDDLENHVERIRTIGA